MKYFLSLRIVNSNGLWKRTHEYLQFFPHYLNRGNKYNILVLAIHIHCSVN
jgi:hypothetical protein